MKLLLDIDVNLSFYTYGTNFFRHICLSYISDKSHSRNANSLPSSSANSMNPDIDELISLVDLLFRSFIDLSLCFD